MVEEGGREGGRESVRSERVLWARRSWGWWDMVISLILHNLLNLKNKYR